jgi:hypothetical protein
MAERLKPTALDRLLGIDPVHEFLRDGLNEPADAAIRSTMMLAILEHLHKTLTDPACGVPARGSRSPVPARFCGARSAAVAGVLEAATAGVPCGGQPLVGR